MQESCLRLCKSLTLRTEKDGQLPNVNFSEPPTVGMSATANWRVEYDDFLDDFVKSVGNDTAMSELEDITGAVFRNKSKLLGQLVAGLIETKYSHLLDQDYCAASNAVSS